MLDDLEREVVSRLSSGIEPFLTFLDFRLPFDDFSLISDFSDERAVDFLLDIEEDDVDFLAPFFDDFSISLIEVEGTE